MKARLRTREFVGCADAELVGALGPVIVDADVKDDPPDVTVEPAIVGAVPAIETACAGSEPVLVEWR